MEQIVPGDKLGNKSGLQKISRTDQILGTLNRLPLAISPEQYRECTEAFNNLLQKVRRDARLKDALSNQSAAQTHVG